MASVASAPSQSPCTEKAIAPVAQGIEHRIPNPGVASSNLAGGIPSPGGVALPVQRYRCDDVRPADSAHRDELHIAERVPDE